MPDDRALDPRGELAQMEVETLREQLGEAFRDFDVLRAQHRLRPREDRDLRAVGVEHVSHLGGDVAAADDADSFRQLLQPHDRIGRVEAVLDETADRRIVGPRAGCDEDVVGGDRAALDVQQLRTDEPGGGLDQCDVRGSVGAVARARRRRSGRCGRRPGRGSRPSRRRRPACRARDVRCGAPRGRGRPAARTSSTARSRG